MAMAAPPIVDCKRLHPGLAVPDFLAAAAFYVEKPGFRMGFTWGEPPRLASVHLGNVEVFLNAGFREGPP